MLPRFSFTLLMLTLLVGVQSLAYAAPCLMMQTASMEEQKTPAHTMEMSQGAPHHAQADHCFTQATPLADCLPDAAPNTLSMSFADMPPLFHFEPKFPLSAHTSLVRTDAVNFAPSPLLMNRRFRI